MVMMEEVNRLSELLGNILRLQKLTISVAESCTGGLISTVITDIPGSSDYFDRGFVTYSNRAKTELLGVDPAIIEKCGAVSRECAEAMVTGAKERSGSDLCVATTGIAGPGGGTDEKPVGLVYAGFYINGTVIVRKLLISGNRESVRSQTAEFCIRFIIDYLSGNRKAGCGCGSS